MAGRLNSFAVRSPKKKARRSKLGAKPGSPASRAIQHRFAVPERQHIKKRRLPARSPSLDLVGDYYCSAHSPEVRRQEGITLTPPHIVELMVKRAQEIEPHIQRVIDPGAGTGRFTISALTAYPESSAHAIERNPALVSLLRDNLRESRIDAVVQVHQADYRDVALPTIHGRSLFLGNPPYVRHHHIDPARKNWYCDSLRRWGINASTLAGLHAHFIVKSYQLAQPGDLICFITSAEWMDVKYGSALRNLLLSRSSEIEVSLFRRDRPIFDDALTTSVIILARVGDGVTRLRIREINNTDEFSSDGNFSDIPIERALTASSWTSLISSSGLEDWSSLTSLGDLFSVHRGQVTGNNQVWIAGAYQGPLPESVLFPTVTRAKELLALSNFRLTNAKTLRTVVDLPPDFSCFDSDGEQQIRRFIRWAERVGAKNSYIASHRSPWFRVGLRSPAPIIVTYMARQPPRFVRNMANARLLNIAHGLYPREALRNSVLDAFVSWLNKNVNVRDGRTYAGGLTKFEPREVERIRVPQISDLLLLRSQQ